MTSGMVFTVKADIDDLKKKMADVGKSVEVAATSSTKSIDKIKGGLQSLSRTKVDIGGNLVQKFNEGETAAEGFGKVAGSALEGFGQAAKGAASLLGPVGEILATIGITVAIGFATNLIEKWSGSVKEATDAIKQMLERQQAVNDIQKEGNKNAAAELTSLKIIYDATQNLNLSNAERIKAAKALQDQYPETFQNFSTEQILLGNAKSGYDSLTASILRQATAKAALGKLSDIAAQKLDIEFQKAKIISKTNQEIDAVKKPIFVSSGSSSGGSSMTGGSGVSNDVIISTEEQKIKVTNRRTEALKPLIQQLKNLGQTEKFITDFIGSANLLGAAIEPQKEEKEIKVKQIKIKPEKGRKALIIGPEDIEAPAEIMLNTDLRFKNLNSFSAELKEGIEKRLSDLDIKFNANDSIGTLGTLLRVTEDKIQATQTKVANDLNGIISNTLSSVGTGFAEAIGKGLGGGNIDGIFNSLLKSLAGGVKQLGQSLVQTYLIIALIKKIKFSNPIAGIAAGFALIALGSFIDAKLAKTPGFANGVRNFGGGVALVGERGPELVNLPRGSDVIPNNQLGGRIGGGSSADVNVSGQFIVRGTDLVAVLNRSNDRINRNS